MGDEYPTGSSTRQSRFLLGPNSVGTPFADDTPLALIEAVAPDVLVKGGDWAIESIVGREVVEARGGRVLNVPLRVGLSTTALERRIAEGRSALDT